MTRAIKAILLFSFCAWCFVLKPQAALADEYLPMYSPNGKDVGRYYRADGSAPTKVQAETDRRSCFMDDREISKLAADRIAELIKINREGAAIELARAIRPCMIKKGWRIVMDGDVITPERSTIAVVDVALDQISSTLPRQMDEHSDLVLVKRDRTDVIYTIQVRPTSQFVVNEMRSFAIANPRASEIMQKSLMKQRVCEPEPNKYLKEGFAIIYEMRDTQGIVWRTRLTLDDCK